METRLYIIRNKKVPTDKPRIVDSPTSAAAVRHVASDVFSVEVGKAKEIARLTTEEGVRVEPLASA